ncbi:MAG: hypothetical protein A2020_13530 [Lentisphaerae bacterium GWF2_45_14]|nr:MAG: hypothetical protein A2020_13530 [Lentisphaerae bacterium GWF2_45_14]
MQSMDFLFKIRSRVVLCFLVLWSVAVSITLFHYTVSARGKYLEMGDKLAWKEGIIPSVRGRILDKNKKILAWTEKYFDLFLTGAGYIEIRRENEMMAELADIIVLEPIKINSKTMLLKKNLSPEEIILIDMIVSKYPEFKIIPRDERRTIDYSRVRSIIGTVKIEDNMMIGVNGLERTHNRLLSGSDGLYVVMLDKQGNWVRGTWKLLRKPKPGKDLILESNVEELRRQMP